MDEKRFLILKVTLTYNHFKFENPERIINRFSLVEINSTGYLTTDCAFYMPWYAKGVHFTYFLCI